MSTGYKKVPASRKRHENFKFLKIFKIKFKKRGGSQVGGITFSGIKEPFIDLNFICETLMGAYIYMISNG